MDLTDSCWRTSSYSAGSGSNGSCVEVAFLRPAVAVRDSKAPRCGALVVSGEVWRSFLQYGPREE